MLLFSSSEATGIRLFLFLGTEDERGLMFAVVAILLVFVLMLFVILTLEVVVRLCEEGLICLNKLLISFS